MTMAQATRVSPRILSGLRISKAIMHTNWSDGSAAAVERDYRYIAITDHTKGLKTQACSMRNNLSSKEIR